MISLSTAAEGLQRLTALLPLHQQIDSLSPVARRIFQATLCSFAENGRALQVEEMSALESGDPKGPLKELSEADLVVLDKNGNEVAGAYPFADRATAHMVEINGQSVHAMCALDAVAIAPMFRTETRVTSRCAHTDEAVTIAQRDSVLLNVRPTNGVLVGIRWQAPGGHSAHSLCQEMVFLTDAKAAGAWGQTRSDCTFYELGEALAFAKGFFLPLMDAANE